MKVIKFLSLVVIVVVVLILGLLVAVSFVDIDRYKGLIEKQVEAATGRAFAIAGDSELNVSLQPGIVLQDVHLGNAQWGSRADMVRVGRAEVQLALVSLLSGRIEVLKLNLSDPDIVLETDQNGQGNWVIGSGEPPDEASEAPSTSASEGMGIDVALHEVRLENARLLYRDGVTQQDTELNLDEMTIMRDDSDHLVWNIAAQLNAIPVAINGTTGYLTDLLNNRPFQSELSGKLGNVEFAVQETVAQPLNASDINVKASVKAPNLETLSRLAGTELPPLESIELAGEIADVGAHYGVNLQGAAGAITLVLGGRLGKSLDGQGMQLDFTTQVPELKSLENLVGTELPTVGAVALKGSVADASEAYRIDVNGAVADIKVSADGLVGKSLNGKGLDIQYTVEAPDLKTAAAIAATELPDIGPIKAAGKASESKGFYHATVDGSVADLKIEGEGKIAQSLDPDGMSAKALLEAPNLEIIARLAQTELPALGPVSVKADLIDKGEVYQVSLDAKAGDINAIAAGTVADSLDGKGVDVDLALKAPDVKPLGELGETELPPVGPVDVKAKLTDIEGGYKLSGLNAKVGDSDLQGEASVAYQTKPILIKAKLNSERLDLAPFEKEKPAAKPEKATPETKTKPVPEQAGSSKDRLFSDEPLPFEQLKTVNADIRYTAKKFESRTRDLSNVEVALRLKNGRLELMPVQAQTGNGAVKADATVDASKAKPKVGLNLKIMDVVLGDLKAFAKTMQGGKMSATVNVRGAGESVRQIMAGLNGKLVVDVGAGEMDNKAINLIGADVIVQLLNTINPFGEKAETAPIECAVVKFDIKDGIAKTDKGIVLETNKMFIIGDGQIDLRDEKIDIHIRSQAREGLGIGAGDLTKMVGVGGTLAHPVPGVDAKGVATTGATVGAAVMTAGISYAAQKALETALKDRSPCLTALGKAPPPEAEKKGIETRTTASKLKAKDN